MRLFIITSTILFSFISAMGQEREFKFNLPPPDPFAQANSPDARAGPGDLAGVDAAALRRSIVRLQPSLDNSSYSRIDRKELYNAPSPKPAETAAVRPEGSTSFRWKPAVVQSLMFLAIQHGYRMREEKTRIELDGPFFRDWVDSLKNLRGWDDGGRFTTNYLAHPLQGAVVGRIFFNNSPRSQMTEIGKSKRYWKAQLKAMAWSAVWSTQYELGPLGEAAIGNVGQKLNSRGGSKMTYGDLVVTPIGGMAVQIGEDAVDKFFLRNIVERKIHNHLIIKIIRTFFTPTMSMANLLRFRMPWYRDDRFRRL